MCVTKLETLMSGVRTKDLNFAQFFVFLHNYPDNIKAPIKSNKINILTKTNLLSKLIMY